MASEILKSEFRFQMKEEKWRIRNERCEEEKQMKFLTTSLPADFFDSMPFPVQTRNTGISFVLAQKFIFL